MSSLTQVLAQLGVDFSTPFSLRHYKFFAGTAMMPLCVELWPAGERNFVSVTHYGEQNGDLMADPDMLFEFASGEFLPVHFQNDCLHVFQRCREYDEHDNVAVNPSLDRELRAFADSWARDIEENGYSAEKKEAEPPG